MNAISSLREPRSSFLPSFHVLTPEPAAPTPRDISFAPAPKRFPGIGWAEAVCWTGSAAIGWVDPLSDVDLYVFSGKELKLLADETMQTWTPADERSGLTWLSWLGRCGDMPVDLKVRPANALATVLATYRPPHEPEFCGLS